MLIFPSELYTTFFINVSILYSAYSEPKEQQAHFCFAALHLYYSFVLRVVSPIRVNFTSPSATPRVCCV